jgi:phospholipase/lecithinase/hemolysin
MRLSCYLAFTLALCNEAFSLKWSDTKFLFVFGDSYTTTGFNITLGVDSPVPGFVSSNGPNWVQELTTTFNVGNTTIINLASGGATTDAKLVTPFEPTVLSLVDQTNQFNEFLAPKPQGAEWSSNNALFAIWIGINDVGNTVGIANQTAFYNTILTVYFDQVRDMYSKGARNFLFLTVPPVDRAPLFIEQGVTVAKETKAALANYNGQLTQQVHNFTRTHRGLGTVDIFDTQAVFNNLLDNGKVLGFVNTTGFCEAYENGTPAIDTQVLPCAPVANYFWLNTLHPLFTIHTIIAHGITTMLSGF